MKNAETLTIDKEIIRLAGKKRPGFLFIPTASSDSEDYCRNMEKYYGERLGCRVETLLLIRQRPSAKGIREKILHADIIYVGGGNTLKMMNLWRRLGVDKLLKAARERGAVLCGISAGSICWFDSGHSDSRSFYNPKKWQYINVSGLGFIKGINCPHYNSATLGIPRKKHFQAMIEKIGGLGIAIDNGCAVEFIGDKYRVIAAKKNAKAYRVFKRNGQAVSEEIQAKKELAPIKNLYK